LRKLPQRVNPHPDGGFIFEDHRNVEPTLELGTEDGIEVAVEFGRFLHCLFLIDVRIATRTPAQSKRSQGPSQS
jgi:hypothetical protein